MIASVAEFLRYFEAVNQRVMRDLGALPAAADGWTPSAGEGEKAWGINELVGHIASSRLYFLSAYLGRGWVLPEAPDVSAWEKWRPAVQRSFESFSAQIAGTPDAWLQRRVAMIDTPGGSLSGWRVLMMMLEHDVYHRSQIDAYAGLNGWDVPPIYGRTAERIAELQPAEREKHGA